MKPPHSSKGLIAIDPGNDAGVALFQANELVRVELVLYATERRWKWNGPKGLSVVCEIPQHYLGSTVKKSSLKKLEKTADYLIKAMLPSYIHKVFPREWKGQRPKDVENRHTMRVLTTPERMVIRRAFIPEKELHNVLDAVGIGLWALGRT